MRKKYRLKFLKILKYYLLETLDRLAFSNKINSIQDRLTFTFSKLYRYESADLTYRKDVSAQSPKF